MASEHLPQSDLFEIRCFIYETCPYIENDHASGIQTTTNELTGAGTRGKGAASGI